VHKIIIREAFNNTQYENLAEVKDINGNVVKIKKTTKIIKEFKIDEDSDTEINEITENTEQAQQHTLNEREERASPEANTAHQQDILETTEKEEIVAHKPTKPNKKINIETKEKEEIMAQKQTTQNENKNIKKVYDVEGNEKQVKMSDLILSTKTNNGRLLQLKDNTGKNNKNNHIEFNRNTNARI